MAESIIFTKVEFREYIAYSLNSIMLLNTVEKTISYQVYGKPVREMPAIEGVRTELFMGKPVEEKIYKAARVMKNGKNGFQSQMIEADEAEYPVVFSYGINLSDAEMEKLLPYCNALDFEPYRDKIMQMKDEGYCGYRDEVSLYFTGITDSYLPRLELKMSYFYDEEHIWASEKLYRYLIKTFFENNKKVKDWVTPYGGYSLLWG